jgi:hypothetical protein
MLLDEPYMETVDDFKDVEPINYNFDDDLDI